MNYLTDIYSFAILIGVAGAVIAFSIGVYYFVQDKRLMQMKAWASIVVNGLEQSMKLVSGPRKFEGHACVQRASATVLAQKLLTKS